MCQPLTRASRSASTQQSLIRSTVLRLRVAALRYCNVGGDQCSVRVLGQEGEEEEVAGRRGPLLALRPAISAVVCHPTTSSTQTTLVYHPHPPAVALGISQDSPARCSTLLEHVPFLSTSVGDPAGDPTQTSRANTMEGGIENKLSQEYSSPYAGGCCGLVSPVSAVLTRWRSTCAWTRRAKGSVSTLTVSPCSDVERSAPPTTVPLGRFTS
ncbi:uncharacterized protein B0H18DRAFT_1101815 [Fomitopsis serialis]|uniref:uncharacterized protein n=1 Tax=Fomitopsis serialis TaxID=139415 RepID=UPI002008D2A8|nr:uncharacterized protein B0H18DRAFT_1101815 [Neoantrodia serialis]KAH9934330.1 hypothetical protein B0H18DRAFT_1101815 [Neoantrodia serialis]